VYPIVTDAAPAAVDCAPLPPPVEQFCCFSHRSVWVEDIVPVQPVTMASTTMSPGTLVTVTRGDVLLPALVAMLRTGVV
jgi:hypothetical protein